MKSLILTLGLAVAAAPLYACGGEEGGIDTQTEVSALTLSGDVEVPQNGTKPITATAQFADGSSRDVTQDADLTWLVEDPDVAVIDADGMVKGIHVGATRVQAELGDALSPPQTLVVH